MVEPKRRSPRGKQDQESTKAEENEESKGTTAAEATATAVALTTVGTSKQTKEGADGNAASAEAKEDNEGTEDAGVNVLSEEQTNAAMEALQEASKIVIEAKDHPEEKVVKEDDDDGGEKRKASDEPDAKPPAKRRPATRVSWEDRLEMLRAYKEKHGNLLIPIRYKPNPALGKFIHNTREQYKLFHKRTPPNYKKKCSLTPERIKDLDDLGFVWSTERGKKQQEDWQGRLEQLRQYKEEHGNCLVPHGYTKDPSFAEWIHRQRTTYSSHLKEKTKNPLVEERMKQLADLGFSFKVHKDTWMEHYDMLKQYKERHGHTQVPTHFAEEPKLGRWVHTQRHQRRLQLKGKKNTMTQERVDLLDVLGFQWEVRPGLERPRATWQQRFDELKDFQKENGHFRVPAGTQPQLHSWCQEQKQRLKQLDKVGKDNSKRMGPERVQKLKEIGFDKDVMLVSPGLKDPPPEAAPPEAAAPEAEAPNETAAEAAAPEAEAPNETAPEVAAPKARVSEAV